MVERHIYGYRWKETGVYVYVGSAFDMADRDRERVATDSDFLSVGFSPGDIPIIIVARSW